jgi:hypothetical protein
MIQKASASSSLCHRSAGYNHPARLSYSSVVTVERKQKLRVTPSCERSNRAGRCYISFRESFWHVCWLSISKASRIRGHVRRMGGVNSHRIFRDHTLIRRKERDRKGVRCSKQTRR